MAVRKQDTPFYFPSMPSVQTLYVLSLLANKRTYCTELRKPVLRRLLLNTSSQFVLLLLLLLLHLPRSQLLLVWEPCTLPHTRQSPPAPTLVLHAAAAPPYRLLLLPMLLLLPQALAGSTLGTWLTLGTRQPPRPP